MRLEPQAVAYLALFPISSAASCTSAGTTVFRIHRHSLRHMLTLPRPLGRSERDAR